MKKTFLILIIILLNISCKSTSEFNLQKDVLSTIRSKNDTIKELDLSDKKLSDMPNLSEYIILKLNLSNNQIITFRESYLPKGIKELDFNNNEIKGFVKISETSKLERLNMSNNMLEKFYTDKCISKLDLSNNNLTLIQMPLYDARHIKLDSLNISNNKKLDNYLGFYPDIYSFIKRENILNNEPLKCFIERPVH